jgi:hypothetical protein
MRMKDIERWDENELMFGSFFGGNSPPSAVKQIDTEKILKIKKEYEVKDISMERLKNNNEFIDGTAIDCVAQLLLNEKEYQYIPTLVTQRILGEDNFTEELDAKIDTQKHNSVLCMGEGQGTSNIDSAKRYLEKIDSRQLIIPICHMRHWFMIKLQDGEAQVYNSSKMNDEFVIKKIIRFFADYSRINRMSRMNCSMQNDITSCGVYLLYFIHSINEGESCSSEIKVSDWRKFFLKYLEKLK